MPADLIHSICRLGLFVWLIWLPLPFGSVTAFSQYPLVVTPLLLLLLILATEAMGSPRKRLLHSPYPLPWRLWTTGGVLFLLLTCLQIAPIGKFAVSIVSPESSRIWTTAANVHDKMVPERPQNAVRHTISVSPRVTRLHLLRVAAYLACFQLGFLLLRQRTHRNAFAIVLAASALFQAGYGYLAFTGQTRYGTHYVWGWHNTKIFRRVSGTFVNPNHFAAYLAIILPILIVALLYIVRRDRRTNASLVERFAYLLEHGLLLFVVTALSAMVTLAGILLSQSRSVLAAMILSLGGLIILIAAYASPVRRGSHRVHRRRARTRVLAGLMIGVLVLAIAVGLIVGRLGVDATVSRFLTMKNQEGLLIGRTIGFEAAVGVWKKFPVFGSGLGTFDHVVLMTQRMDLNSFFDHAHNDYLEILATTGLAGLLIAVGSLAAGALAMIGLLSHRGAAVDEDDEISEKRRRRLRESRWSRYLIIGALTSLMVAMLHALVDFDFFIPAIPATLATILGAACASSLSLMEHGDQEIPEPRRN